MRRLEDILNGLESTPRILAEMMAAVPAAMVKERRLPGRWTIHEHACHLVQVQPLILERFKRFSREETPEFTPFIPGTSEPDDTLLEMDLDDALGEFPERRREILDLVAAFDDALWRREALHPEYTLYTPFILLRHTLFHDHFHLYRIETLWLTVDGYLGG